MKLSATLRDAYRLLMPIEHDKNRKELLRLGVLGSLIAFCADLLDVHWLVPKHNSGLWSSV